MMRKGWFSHEQIIAILCESQRTSRRTQQTQRALGTRA